MYQCYGQTSVIVKCVMVRLVCISVVNCDISISNCDISNANLETLILEFAKIIEILKFLKVISQLGTLIS